MIADGVRDTDLGAYQRAARLLLVHPLITRLSPDPDALPLIRRFGPSLALDFGAVAGYRLELGPTCARLVKRADRLDPTQSVQPRDRKPFDRRRYAYLCLVLGALGRAGTQVALTELADALRRRAAEVDGLGFDPDEYRHRLAFVDVLLHLEALGILRPIDVSSVTWLKDPDVGEALYDVDRDAAHQLFVPPRVIQHLRSAASLLADELSASRDTRRAASRQRLARLLLEHPVVCLDDLTEADRAYLLNQARSLGDDLARLTGAVLERRAEGVALIDTSGGFSDRRPHRVSSGRRRRRGRRPGAPVALQGAQAGHRHRHPPHQRHRQDPPPGARPAGAGSAGGRQRFRSGLPGMTTGDARPGGPPVNPAAEADARSCRERVEAALTGIEQVQPFARRAHRHFLVAVGPTDRTGRGFADWIAPRLLRPRSSRDTARRHPSGD